MQHTPDHGVTWREELIEEHGERFDFLDPHDTYDNPEDVTWRQPGESHEDIDGEVYTTSEIVNGDREMLRNADAMLMALRDVIEHDDGVMPAYSHGTAREHEFAVRECRIPVIVWYDDRLELSPWVLDDAAFVSTSLDDCLTRIEQHHSQSETAEHLFG